MEIGPQDVLKFWFEDSKPRQWFIKDENFDAQLREKFLETYHQAVRGETKDWRGTPEGRLAEILVIDQFARNMFRGRTESFMRDKLALTLAEEAVRVGDDKKLSPRMRHFIYMPYMHSESPEAHKKAIWLFLWSWNWGALLYERRHKKIIDRFGRYPHRNDILGRQSTEEEKQFMLTHSGF